MSFCVLVQEPRTKPLYVRCKDEDACLKVIEHEVESTPAGTRVTMLRKVRGRPHMEPIRAWRVGESGARGYKINPMSDAEVGKHIEEWLAAENESSESDQPEFIPNLRMGRGS